MNSLGHDNSRLILPRCGITWLDLWSVKAKAMSARHAAQLLGVDYDSLLDGLKREQLDGFFPDRRPRGAKPKVSRRQLQYYARQGMAKMDVAAELNIDYSWLCKRIKTEKLTGFPCRGEAIKIARKGYCR